jgi:acyl-coenzyme A thioesterase PaaI-like protein
MDVTALPFTRLLGLERGASGSGLLVSLPASAQHANHLGTVHAGALLTVAEAGSAEFLLRHFGEIPGYVPVVRRVEAKFRRPARGRVSARASADERALSRLVAALESKGRALIGVSVEVVDEGGAVVLSAVVDWFIARAADGAA